MRVFFFRITLRMLTVSLLHYHNVTLWVLRGPHLHVRGGPPQSVRLLWT